MKFIVVNYLRRPAAYVLAGCVCWTAVSTPAAVTADRGYDGQHTLDGYTAYALAHNPGLKSAMNTARAEKERAGMTVSLPAPMFMAGVAVTGGARLSGVGVSQQVMGPAMMFLERKAAQQRYEAGLVNVELNAADLVHRVNLAYVMLYETGRMLEIRKESLALLKQYEESARKSYAAGQTGQSSLLKMHIEIAALEDAIAADAVEADSRRRELGAVMGVDALYGFPFPDSLPSYLLGGLPAGASGGVMQANPALREMRMGLQAAQTMVRAARSAWVPGLGVSLEYMIAQDNGTMNAGAGPLSLGVSIGLPVWSGSRQAAVRRAREMGLSMDHAIEEMENMVAADSVMFANTVRDAARRSRLLSDVLVPQARQMVAVMDTEYRNGMARAIDVMDARRMLFDLEMQQVEAQVRQATAAAGLMKLTGYAGAEGGAR